MKTVALAGYGSAGRGIHAPLLQAAEWQITGVSTRNADRAAHVEQDLPHARVVPDLDGLLALGADLVVLATPSGAHVEHATACINAGQAVVVDKPLAVDAAGARELVDRAQERGVPLTVFQNRRFDPQHTTLRRLLDEAALGEVFRHEFRWERWRPTPKDRWRENATPQEGGGILLDLQSHMIDAAVDLFGPVARVFAQVAARSTPAEDDSFVVCEHARGVTTHLSATSLAGAPGPRLRVLGRQGAYVLDDFEQEVSAFPDLAHEAGQAGWIVRGEHRERVASAAADQADFYLAVAAALDSPDPQAGMPVDPREAVHVLAVIDAARLSAAEHRVVAVAQ